MSEPRVVFAGNRRLAYLALQHMLDIEWKPVGLMTTTGPVSGHADEMRALLPDVPLLPGKAFRTDEGLATLRELAPDYIVGVHFPYIVPTEVLELPTFGVLNLHPAYLPYNRGWHTPSWAILDGTPYGATLHWMSEKLDTGDIALQRAIDVRPHETANELYQRVLALELEVFCEALPMMRERRVPRIPQKGDGTSHLKKDLEAERRLSPDDRTTVGALLDRLRALTTNDVGEAAIVTGEDGDYWVQVQMGPVSQDEG